MPGDLGFFDLRCSSRQENEQLPVRGTSPLAWERRGAVREADWAFVCLDSGYFPHRQGNVDPVCS